VPRYLLRDRDGIFGGEFRQDVEAMGIQEVLSAPRSPWQRAYVERVIGTIRRECLDHMIVLNEASLYRHVKSFLAARGEKMSFEMTGGLKRTKIGMI
jgi:transposase InsO family protein